MRKYPFLLTITALIIALTLLVTGCQVSNNPLDGKVVQADTIDTDNDEQIEDNKELSEEEKKAELDKKIEERKILEEQRKQELGEFYVPLLPLDEERKIEKIEAKGLFVTGHVAGMPIDKSNVEMYAQYAKALHEKDNTKINELKSKVEKLNKFERILGIAVATEINSLVIDVKDDDGLMTYKSEIPIVEQVEANRSIRIKDINSLMELLKEYDIYPIARIVTFKDKNLASHRTDHAIQLKSGGVWRDNKGVAWVNPYDKFVWNYDIAIAREAILNGFKEIQFDYIRFPDNAKKYNPITEFPGRDGRAKDEAVEDFLEYAKQELEQYKVNLAADVFGVITKSWDDKPEDIGQTWRKMAKSIDYMCPMIYPSHYGQGWYGYQVPDQEPYGVLAGALKEAIERNASLESPPIIRPWIQGFTAPWIKGHINYTSKEIREQILAGKELGINEYIVWNAGNTYDPLAYFLSEAEKDVVTPDKRQDKEKDLIGRTPESVLKDYLSAEKNKVFSKMYLLTPIKDRPYDYEEFKTGIEGLNLKLVKFEVKEYNLIDDNNAEVKLSYEYTSKAEEKELKAISEEDTWKLKKEHGIWKVIRPELKPVQIEEKASN
ncbi:putative glycoside hydrolase [Proteiniborus sp.]|uniref:putative glycoside hydrolase n=1 Tax=Proteiniborus sp. TaxID=2079015 RepID=UPI003322BF27